MSNSEVGLGVAGGAGRRQEGRRGEGRNRRLLKLVGLVSVEAWATRTRMQGGVGVGVGGVGGCKRESAHKSICLTCPPTCLYLFIC